MGNERVKENFDLQQGGKLQLMALDELDHFVTALNDGDNLIKEGKIELSRYLEILDPNNWCRLFSLDHVMNYRDIEGHPLFGKDYDEKMETVFTRFINPTAEAFARHLTDGDPDNLDGEWSEILLVLQSWSNYKHWFFYACDPFGYIDQPEKEVFDRDPSDEILVSGDEDDNDDED